MILFRTPFTNILMTPLCYCFYTLLRCFRNGDVLLPLGVFLPLTLVELPFPDLGLALHLLQYVFACHKALLAMGRGYRDDDRRFADGHRSQAMVRCAPNDGGYIALDMMLGARRLLACFADNICHRLHGNFAIRLIVQTRDNFAFKPNVVKSIALDM